MLYIDGSYQEGGGQILRTALALSVLTQTPFTATKIRCNRPQPGLKNQHLHCITALQQLTGARVKGARLASETVTFIPGPVVQRSLEVTIGTAGSITLALQALLLPSMFANGATSIKLIGGTDTRWSIPIDYFTRIILPYFIDIATIKLHTRRRGYYPKGQGVVTLRIRPRQHISKTAQTQSQVSAFDHGLSQVRLTHRSQVVEIRGISAASDSLKGADVVRRQINGVKYQIGGKYPVSIKQEYGPSASPGTAITLWAQCAEGRLALGADALGRKGLRAEKVGAAAARRLMALIDSKAALSHHLADNLIPLLALVGGAVKPDKISGHILSNIYVCEKFLTGRFKVNAQNNLIEAFVPYGSQRQ
jgi:RNA 3'-phosphate cyclase